MIQLRSLSTQDSTFVQSFELTNGASSGDLLSERITKGKLKVGFLGTAYFEYYRMYQGIQEQAQKDIQKIADFLESECDLVFPGIVDTLDKSNSAGVLFASEKVEAIIIAEATYSVDYLVHQALLNVPKDIPLFLFASQSEAKIHYSGGYAASLLNSGPMGIVQFACSLQKMERFLPYETTVGCIDEPEVQEKIKAFIKVRTAIRDLHSMNIGLIGHIFRGMYDFQYDKTELTGKLGPHVIDIDIKHLTDIYDEINDDDLLVKEIIDKAKADYEIDKEITDVDLKKAAKLGAALEKTLSQYKLDGMALLGQHFIEARTQTTSYMGIGSILSKDAGLIVTEGDVLGLIVSFVMKTVSGETAFFGEWEEIDVEKNELLILGHGFLDPKTARKDRPIKLGSSCEDWGWEGTAPGFECTLTPGPATLGALISHNGKWKMLISEVTIPDTPPLKINESTVIIKPEENVRDYYSHVIEFGFGHHVMVSPGHIGRELEMFAKAKGFEICKP